MDDEQQFAAGLMMRPALKPPATDNNWVTASPDSGSRQTQGFLPFYLIGSVAVGLDSILIVGTNLFTGVAYYLAFSDGVPPVETLFAVGALTCIIFSAILAALGAYQPQQLVNFRKQVRLATTVWLLVFSVLSFIAFAFKVSSTFSRGATLAYFVVGWTAIALWRFILARYIAWALTEGRFAQQKVLLLVEEGQFGGLQIVDGLRRCGYLPVKTFTFERKAIASGQLQSSLDEIVEITREEKIECVFIVACWEHKVLIEQLMNYLTILPISVYLLPDTNVAHFLGGRGVEIGTTWTAELKRSPLTHFERAGKRALDLLIASTSLILLAPLMFFVAIIIKLEGRGPIFFMQTRNGFNGRPFLMCKFRTMSVLEDGPIVRHVTKNDPRVTRLGKLLRRTCIDELPQLFNVISGNMSLVGPRPHASALNSEYERNVANYAFRYHVKPGLTGWAQINGLRGEMQLDRVATRVEYDLWYINNWSFWLDFKIILRTLLLGLQANG